MVKIKCSDCGHKCKLHFMVKHIEIRTIVKTIRGKVVFRDRNHCNGAVAVKRSNA